jgi:RNA polymerase sigma-70 factor (ECF subfamily)
MSSRVDRAAEDVLDAGERVRFERLVLPHLDAAFNLARWLMRDRTEAEDAAQESMLRAFRFFGGYQGGDARAWLLQIVRNTCYTRLQKHGPDDLGTEFDEELHPQADGTPEVLAIAGDDRDRLMRALLSLPAKFREVLVLREFEECSYKEIATITELPIGTVMSSLARAREKLKCSLVAADGPKGSREGGRS